MNECDSRYSMTVDGKWTEIIPLDECVRAIKGHIQNVERRNEFLEEENKRLKDDVYKDEEMQKMKSKYEAMHSDYYRGFPISEEEDKKIREWMYRHDKEKHTLPGQEYRYSGASGGAYEFIFCPTGFGVSGVVRCSCGEEFCFQELG